ncbi:MAG: methionine synthase [Acidobacteriota bacterium]|nr:methionine synthase [Acidobacteriota bacterium]
MDKKTDSTSLSPFTAAGTDRTEELRSLMAERILVLDGAMGTMLQNKDLGPDDFGGPELEGCNEILVRTRPDVILDVHRAYLEAGADLIETDTFGGTPLVLAEYGLETQARELNRLAAELAVAAAQEFSTSGKPRFVVGSIGPTTKAISVTGGITFSELVRTFGEQVRGLMEGGVDLLFIETSQDTRNVKAALIAAEHIFADAGVRRPLVVSGTIEMSGTMLGGQAADAFLASIEHADLLAVGLNCATGPDLMTDHLRTISQSARWAVSCFPNAGLPDEDGHYPETPDSLSAALARFADEGWLNIVGGCCGTTDAHTAALAAMVEGRRPRPLDINPPRRAVFTGIDLVEPDDSNRPLLVGERTNVIGSKKFREMVAAGEWDEAVEIARRQVKGGAQIIDVCLQSTEGDEVAEIREFFDRLGRAVKAPIMIDSTDPGAVEVALTYCQGKSIVNSINLEDGEGRIEAVAPLLRRYGAAVIFGTIDEDPEQAQAFTRERKLEIARRGHRLLTGTYGVPEEDIVFDPLVFPAASGDESYIGGAVETIEGLRLIKQALPVCTTVLGISNVSFGLPIRAREIVNSVFLYLCTKAGLDLAIVNSERLERYAAIPDAERRMVEALLANSPPGPGEADDPVLADAPDDWREQDRATRAAIHHFHVTRVTDHFRGAKREAIVRPEQPLDERLAGYIIDGSRTGLVADLDQKRGEGVAPLDIINGPLMAGMAEVGRLFNDNELIVAEVLQSAEAMKAAVSHLQQFMDAETSASRGKVVLATVKGDVHDIGKNLVDIILTNNGFDVVDLGIKVPPEKLVRAVREHQPDAVGLSGLLVKSAHQMVVTAEDLAAAGIEVPILVGGAALSARFTSERIAPVYRGGVLYCSDAMAGLDTLLRLVDKDAVESAFPEPAETPDRRAPSPRPRSISTPRKAGPVVRADLAPVPPPRPDRVVWSQVDSLDDVWSYINPQMLYGKHLGLRGSFARLLDSGDVKAEKLNTIIEALKTDVRTWMRVGAVWRFFEAEPDGDRIALFEPGTVDPAHVFAFGRQQKPGGLCLSDFVLPPRDGVRDSVALFVVGAGEGVRERSLAAKDAGEYLASHAIQALAIETAEAAAEWLHSRIRDLWAFPDSPEMTMKDRFAARYRGKRFSFGYPACPDLDDQAPLWRLLRPEEIGIGLTDGMMMEPEASVSALVFHHPDARYFSVSGTR